VGNGCEQALGSLVGFDRFAPRLDFTSMQLGIFDRDGSVGCQAF
jgi:hypothetical protein